MRLSAGLLALLLSAALVTTGCSSLSTAGRAALPQVSVDSEDDGPGNPAGGDGGADTGSLPTGLGVPGFDSGCIAVGLSYASMMLALLPTTLRGNGAFDAGKINAAIDSLKGQVPDELQGDVEVIAAAARAAAGKPLAEAGESLGSPEVKAATDHINAWLEQHCNR